MKITVKIKDLCTTYGDPMKDLDFYIKSGSVDKKTLAKHITLSKENGKDVGKYNVTGKCNSKKYKITFINGTYTIVPRGVTAKVESQKAIYGEATKALTYKITKGTVMSGDNLGVVLTKAEGTAVGEYAITGTASNTNYNVTFVDGTYTITTREVTVTIDDKTSEYGEDLKELTSNVTEGTVVEGDDLGIVLTKAEGKDAGEYAITGTSSNTNYSVTFVNGTYTITRINTVKELLDWTIEDKTYNKEAQGVIVKAKEGVEGLGEITVRYNGQEEIPQEAGTYEVTVDVAEGTNYKEETGIRLGSYTIKPAEVTVTIDNKTSVYGEDLKELTSNVTEGTVIEGDDLGIALTKAEGTTVGEYAITGTASNTNYNVTFVNGTYTITTREVTVTIDNKTSVYGEKAKVTEIINNIDETGAVFINGLTWTARSKDSNKIIEPGEVVEIKAVSGVKLIVQ